ncbi:PRC-barrel domain-containing protein [Kribbella pittospori]|nr:PRC-barrel domain-containing protein [Kribbella pittospori]
MNDSPRMLVRLHDVDLTLADPAQDFHGRKVVDRNGEEVGDVVGLIIDEDLRRVRLLEIQSGGASDDLRSTQVLPIDVIIAVDDRSVRISPDRLKVASGPIYYRDVLPERPYYASIYSYYDCPPFWWPGYTYPELVAET